MQSERDREKRFLALLRKTETSSGTSGEAIILPEEGPVESMGGACTCR